jgi:hypothetical protein
MDKLLTYAATSCVGPRYKPFNKGKRGKMGAWGEGILENDDSSDMFYGFMDRHDDGLKPSRIHRELVESYVSGHDSENLIGSWLGLAQAEWKCGYRNAETYEQVKRIAESPHEHDEWQQARKDIFVKFLEMIASPAAQPRKRKKRVQEQPVFPEGACLAVKLHIGGYGAAIVMRNVAHDWRVSTLIAGLKGVFQEAPTMDVFENREWLYLTHHGFGKPDGFANKTNGLPPEILEKLKGLADVTIDRILKNHHWQHHTTNKVEGRLLIVWVAQKNIVENRDKVVIVGQTTIRDNDPRPEIDDFGIGDAGIGWIENQIWLQDKWDKENAVNALSHEIGKPIGWVVELANP